MVLHYEINNFDRIRDAEDKNQEFMKFTKAGRFRKFYIILWQVRSCVLL